MSWWWERRRRWWEDCFREFEEVDRFFRELMERAFEDRTKIKPEAGKTYVYGFTYYIGPDGKPVFREFGNVRPSKTGFMVQEEREPLVEVYEEGDEVIIVAEVPGVNKEDIELTVSGRELEISVDTPKRKYYKRVELPKDVDPDTIKASYRNGILEVKVKKLPEEKEKKKRIKIE
jgi:HSP20 family protein